MLFKKRKRNYKFEEILKAFAPYKKDYAIQIKQNNADIELNIESLIKPSKPPKRTPTSLKTSKTEEKIKAD